MATLRPDGSGGVELFYVHADHLNTPRLVTDTANNLRWRWESDPFGTNLPDENPSSLGVFKYSLRFPGQQFDGILGLHYNYFRDYDPALGRYVQSDPIGLAGGTNTFAYADANPAEFSDPFGLDVTINITNRSLSSTGNSVGGTVSVSSTMTPIAPYSGHAIENTHPTSNRPVVPGGSYSAYVRTDHNPNRIELRDVPGRTYIQIHTGNYPGEFQGCFGVGNTSSEDSIGGSVTRSTESCRSFNGMALGT